MAWQQDIPHGAIKYMNRAKKIKLIGKTYTQDAISQYVATETVTEIFAIVRDVSGTEYERPVEGLRPSKVFDVLMTEYDGQDLIEYKGVRYHIYRTYLRDDVRIELYGGVRIGNDFIGSI